MDNYVAKARPALRANYTDEQMLEGLYITGTDDNYRNGALATGRFGPAATEYINTTEPLVSQANSLIWQTMANPN
jgi:hypothetical protein